MKIRDLNWMQLEKYLELDDRIVLPVGSTEQHAYLFLGTDNILAERASVEAAGPLGVPVLPVVAYGVTGLPRTRGVPHCARPRCSRFSRTSSTRCSARDSPGYSW
jgi:creatinine amidohydrolase/Fe(II)-dependent formamide hydrolase-like protein